MNEQESQQAQTIAALIKLAKLHKADIEKHERLTEEERTSYSWVIGDMLKIVDPQAQKITASATVIEEMHAHTVTLNALYLQAEGTIAEQAKEIERLKDDLLQARRCAEGMADSHAILDGDESEIEHRIQMRQKRSPLPWEKA